MDSNVTKLTFFFIASFLSFLAPAHGQALSSPITAVFAIGDSTVDSGNNNRLATLVRSDHWPYGRDFPGNISSGRFSNGKLVTDYVVSSLGLKELLPAYLDPTVTNKDLLTGVSFASGGSGLDDLTVDLGNVIGIQRQLENFEEAVERIEWKVGEEETRRIVENAVVLVSVGTNDMLYNFYMLPTRVYEFTVSGYHDFLLAKLESVVERLYKVGARRLVVAGLPPIGCLPVQVTIGSIIPSAHMLQRACVDQQNTDSESYNAKLRAFTSRMQDRLQHAKVVYLDIYNPLMDMIMNPAKYGFEQTLQGCCGTGLLEMGPLCGGIAPTCPNASKYLFWDASHLTQEAYSIVANIFLKNVLPQLVG